MGNHEFGLYERNICYSADVITIPKGSSGKTGDRLMGCLVPVICYSSDVVLAHFGPLRTEDAQSGLKRVYRTERPTCAYLYRDMLTSDSFWVNRIDEYNKAVEDMKDLIAEASHISPTEIGTYEYTLFAEVVVDWSRGDDPLIYTQPYTR